MGKSEHLNTNYTFNATLARSKYAACSRCVQEAHNSSIMDEADKYSKNYAKEFKTFRGI
jgi:outer membrane scaffolding protein for murein synthesis (MipA/OmpV family)